MYEYFVAIRLDVKTTDMLKKYKKYHSLVLREIRVFPPEVLGGVGLGGVDMSGKRVRCPLGTINSMCST